VTDYTGLPHDLFLLLINLSQFKDRRHVLRVFSQAAEGMWPGLTFTYHKNPPDPGGVVMPLDTVHKRHGFFVVHGDLGALQPSERQLLGNAMQMLALLLERLEQQKQIEDNKRFLEQEVARRTKESEHKTRQLQLAMAGAKIGFWDWYPKSGKVEYSPEWYRILGYKPEETTPDYDFWEKRIHPDDRDAVMADLQKHLEGKTDIFSNDHRLLSKSGQWIWVTGRGSVTESGQDGSPTRITGMMLDITESKAAQEALARSEERLRLHMETSPAGITVVDAGGNLQFANPRAEQILGLNKSDLLSRTYDDPAWKITCAEGKPFPGEELPFNLVKRTMQPVYGMEHAIEWPDGQRVLLSINAAPLVDKHGNFDGMAVALEDITERRKAEAELLAAKEAAEAASHAKSNFLANMSHEIRTPLNGILGMLQLMQTTDLSKEQSEYAKAAMTSGHRLTRLLSDILDISKVEAGKMEILYKSFDLGEIMDTIMHLFTPAADQKGLALSMEQDPRIPRTLRGDAVRLQQVLSNLVGNAIKFTDAGSVDFSAYLLPSSARDRHHVLFTVTDTGDGIPDELLRGLFEPFTQAETDYRRKAQGAGLGLTITKGLVELMGGDMAVSSEVDVGTSMYFAIPLKQAEEERAAPEAYASRPGRRNNFNVLLAEDDKVSNDVAARMLEKSGCRVETVEDGAQAISKLKDRRFDLVLMDVQMPVMDGLEATRAIRSGRAGQDAKDIPIIAMTAYAMSGDREKILAAGMDGYLPKPVDMLNLQRALAKAADKVRM